MSYYLLKVGRQMLVMLLVAVTVLSSGCYSYRINTRAQAGAEVSRTVTANSYFWGLLQKPKDGISTPNCDSLDIYGMSVVRVRTNFGYALITIATLGIWAPIKIEWRCSKPCQQVGHL
jgi:hypothetical protein